MQPEPFNEFSEKDRTLLFKSMEQQRFKFESFIQSFISE